MSNDPKISVVVPTYNRSESLRDTLEGLKIQSLDGVGPDFEVIVVDNHSTDRTREVVEEIRKDFGKPLHYVFEGRQGVAYARNAGVRKAKGEIIAFSDDDVIPDPNWLQSLWGCFLEERADLVGGKIELLWLSEQPSWLSDRLMVPLIAIDHGPKRFQVQANGIRFVTANLACRRSLFNRLGPFREDLGRRGKTLIGGEDFEWFDRVMKAGSRIFYEPEAKVLHKVWGEKVAEDYILRWFLNIGRTHGHMMDWKWHHAMTLLPVWCWKETLNAFFRQWVAGPFLKDKTKALEAKTQELFYRGLVEERGSHWFSRLFRKPVSCHFI